MKNGSVGRTVFYVGLIFFDIDEIKFLSFSFRPLSKIIKQQKLFVA